MGFTHTGPQCFVSYTVPMIGWHQYTEPQLTSVSLSTPGFFNSQFTSGPPSTTFIQPPFSTYNHPSTQTVSPNTHTNTTYPYFLNFNRPLTWSHAMEGGYPRIHNSPFLPFPMPKMDFPRFNGSDPRGWFKKCEKFFQLNPLLEPRSKVLYAAMYLDGEADIWYQALQDEHPWLVWKEFVHHISNQFAKGGHENLQGQFNKLMQRGKVDDYIRKFEELKNYMLSQNRFFTEDNFIESFLSGLKEEIANALNINKTYHSQRSHKPSKGSGVISRILG